MKCKDIGGYSDCTATVQQDKHGGYNPCPSCQARRDREAAEFLKKRK